MVGDSGGTALAVWKADADVLHHALVFVVEDVAVQHVFTDIALVASAHHEGVNPGTGVGIAGSKAEEALHPQGVFPYALESRILGIHATARVIHRARRADILAIRVENLD